MGKRCPRCGSKNISQYDGIMPNRKGTIKKLACLDCGYTYTPNVSTKVGFFEF